VITDSPVTERRAAPVSADAEDRRLVEQFVAGDAAAFDRLVSAHHDRVTRLASRLLGWSVDVDDVVQDVFFAAYRNLAKFRGEAALSTWLAAITINQTHARRLKQLVTLRWLTKAATGRPAPTAAPADRVLADGETDEQVRQAVRSLPARYREVVVLYYLEGLPVAEVAAALKIEAGAVKARLLRARAMLKGKLADVWED
jgi:RNA polymerase sigma-70 factor (ECF subfamily)